MTHEDFTERTSESWFDPAGLLLAVPSDEDPSQPPLLGFHWTKVHTAEGDGSQDGAADGDPAHGGSDATGEVYVVGVTPAAQGMGLGKALTVAGISYLQDQGLHAVMLYVDADNEAAVALYQKLGFVRWDTDVMYAPAAKN